jgi:hypothetical protein
VHITLESLAAAFQRAIDWWLGYFRAKVVVELRWCPESALLGPVAATCGRYQVKFGKSIFRIVQKGAKSCCVAALMRPGYGARVFWPQGTIAHTCLPTNGAACRQQKGLQPSTQTPFMCPRGAFRAISGHSAHPISALPARISHSYL